MKESPVQESSHPSVFNHFQIDAFSPQHCSVNILGEGNSSDNFSVIWLKEGNGTHDLDLKRHYYDGSVMFVLAPGQIHKLNQHIKSEGYIIRFSPAVFQYEKDFMNHILDTCLFDNSSSCPVIQIEEEMRHVFDNLFDQIHTEYLLQDISAHEIICSYLRILISQINRIKRKKVSQLVPINNAEYKLFRSLKIAIEKNYKKEHSVQYYADFLNTQTRALNSVTRQYAERSTSELIQERILLEAQRILYHEDKRVKEVCYELGFDDPAYFTRFFKKHTGLAPQFYKEQAVIV